MLYKVVRNVGGERTSVIARKPLTIRYWVDGRKTHAHPKLAEAGYGLSVFATRSAARQAIQRYHWTFSISGGPTEIWRVEGHDEMITIPKMGFYFAKGLVRGLECGDRAPEQWPPGTHLFLAVTMIEMIEKYHDGEEVWDV